MASMVKFSEAWEHDTLHDTKCNCQNTDIAAQGTHISSQFALVRDVIAREKPLNLPVCGSSHVSSKKAVADSSVFPAVGVDFPTITISAACAAAAGACCAMATMRYISVPNAEPASWRSPRRRWCRHAGIRRFESNRLNNKRPRFFAGSRSNNQV
ncbi:hypothetical protein [Paraburkholderia ribeironis]|uniref:hypothetical protein n=1 Tax=Paraburkholderia ribeironis TaxID=1247936 RepID=UPI0011773F86|nr:hypothetical protein [Paraburkholderia ribeironis]